MDGGGKNWAVMSGGDNGNGWCTKMFSFTIISNLRVKIGCGKFWVYCSWTSSWISCLYCSLLVPNYGVDYYQGEGLVVHVIYRLSDLKS